MSVGKGVLEDVEKLIAELTRARDIVKIAKGDLTEAIEDLSVLKADDPRLWDIARSIERAINLLVSLEVDLDRTIHRYESKYYM